MWAVIGVKWNWYTCVYMVGKNSSVSVISFTCPDTCSPNDMAAAVFFPYIFFSSLVPVRHSPATLRGILLLLSSGSTKKDCDKGKATGRTKEKSILGRAGPARKIPEFGRWLLSVEDSA